MEGFGGSQNHEDKIMRKQDRIAAKGPERLLVP
jgi:hypothetical protein